MVQDRLRHENLRARSPMRQEILSWIGTLSPPDLALAAVMLVFGLVFGWLIWGGRGRYIRELEDDLTAARKQIRRVLVAAEQSDTNDDVETVLAPRARALRPRDQVPDQRPDEDAVQTTAQNDAAIQAREPRFDHDLLQPRTDDMATGQNQPSTPGEEQEVRLAALCDELTKIRQLLGQVPLNTDPLKESLDQADMATKRANGRLKIVMSTPPFADDDQARS